MNKNFNISADIDFKQNNANKREKLDSIDIRAYVGARKQNR